VARIAGQLLASAGAPCIRCSHFRFGGYGAASWLNLPITLVWLMMCANAFNLIDGLDGSPPEWACSPRSSFLAAMLHGNETLAFVTLPLAGACSVSAL
jgi:UDP-N-acetylmuramyl pentapeptide phosphotransferase/UDP-N-acetylglucosamine-1-phosphate transferase